MSKIDRLAQDLSDIPARVAHHIPGVRRFMLRMYSGELRDRLATAEEITTPNRRTLVEDAARTSSRKALIATFGYKTSKKYFPLSFKS